jgi:hypothetical protein
MTGLCHTWCSFDKAVSLRHSGAMTEKRAEFDPLNPGIAAPLALEYRVELEGLYSLDFQARYERGRYVVEQLTIRRRADGPPVTTEGIREIPVTALLRASLEGYLAHAPVELTEHARDGGGPAEQDLRAVAIVYQIAYATGAPPTKTVIQRLGLPRSTASRWIALARERGLLGPATPRKAGG